MADCSVRSRETTEIKGSDRHLGHCWPGQMPPSHSTRPGQRSRDGPNEPVTAGHRDIGSTAERGTKPGLFRCSGSPQLDRVAYAPRGASRKGLWMSQLGLI